MGSATPKHAIIHYQVGKTDGVSLQIEEKVKILKKSGQDVKLISGPNQEGADYIIEDLRFDKGSVKDLEITLPTRLSLGEFRPRYEEMAGKIFRQLDLIFEEEKFDFVHTYNLLSLGRHPASAAALMKVLDKYKVQTFSTSPDIYWERQDIIMGTSPEVLGFIASVHLANRPYIKHIFINSLAKAEVEKRKGVVGEVLPDVFDFDMRHELSEEKKQEIRKELGVGKEDLIVLQATRIVRRKGIELTIDYVAELQKLVDKKIVLLFTNYVDEMEQDAVRYFSQLKEKSQSLGVEFIYAFDLFNTKYSFWDGYFVCDVIAYPSQVEGFGNQFLEAMYAKKPVLVFEYPVFEADIKKEGYEVISLGNKAFVKDLVNGFVSVKPDILEKAARQTVDLLNDEARLKEVTTKNFEIGYENHSLKVLEKFLDKEIAARIKVKSPILIG